MKYYVKKIIQLKYSMIKYRIERDEIYNAKEEINELNRLLNEAKERLESKYRTTVYNTQKDPAKQNPINHKWGKTSPTQPQH